MAIDFKRYIKNIIGTIALPLGMFLLFYMLTKNAGIEIYGNKNSMASILQYTVYSVFVAYAVSLTLKMGMLDFSIGSTVVLASIFAYNINQIINGGPWFLLALCIAFSIIFNAIMGLLYITLRLPIIMISLGVTIVYESLTGMIFGAKGSSAYTIQSLTVFSREPLMYMLLFAVMICYFVFNTYTKTSYKTRALAFNQHAAVSIGIKEKSIIFINYLFIGLILGFATIMYVSQNRVVPVSTTFSSTMILFMNMFPVIIGFYLSKFSNDTIGIFVGALTISFFNYGLATLKLNASLQTIYYGLFMIVFIAYTTNEIKIVTWLKTRFNRA